MEFRVRRVIGGERREERGPGDGSGEKMGWEEGDGNGAAGGGQIVSKDVRFATSEVVISVPPPPPHRLLNFSPFRSCSPSFIGV